VIPRVIYQFWGGPRPPPMGLVRAWKEMNPTFEHRLVTRETGWPNQARFDECRRLGGWATASDYARWNLLRAGGLWIDADAQPVRPLDDRFLSPECWAAWENESDAPGIVASGMVGARPDSPLVLDMIAAIDGMGPRDIVWPELGPRLLTRVARRHPELEVFPARTFYPAHYTGRPAPGDATVFALHHWGGIAEHRRGADGVWLDHPPVRQSETRAADPLSAWRRPPAVSVVVPVFGEAQAGFLHEAIASVRAQAFGDWEVVVAAGGRAGEAAASQHAGPRVTVMNGADAGLADARNRAISVARGRWIYPLDADDLAAPPALGLLARAIGDGELAIASSGFREFGPGGDLPRGPWAPSLAGYRRIREANALLASSMFTRRLWEAAGGYKVGDAGNEDWGFWVSCSELSPSVTVLPDELLRRRVHPASMSADEQGCGPYWRVMIRLQRPSLYDSKTLAGDRRTLAKAPADVVERVHRRLAKNPTCHALRSFVEMMGGAPRVPAARPAKAAPSSAAPCGCVQCRTGAEV